MINDQLFEHNQSILSINFKKKQTRYKEMRTQPKQLC